MTTAPTTIEDRELLPWEAYVPGHHWRNAEDEAEAAKLGMWLFLSTEVLLFGGFFCAYSAFRLMYPENWHEASRYYLSWQIGGINTAVLLLSSFTIVLAIRGAQLGRRWQMMLNLALTNLCALFFLTTKIAYEYIPKIQQGKLPGVNFRYHYHPAAPAHVDSPPPSDIQQAVTDVPLEVFGGAQRTVEAMEQAHHFTPGSHDAIFLSVYWISTATHGLHVFVGVLVISWAMWKAWKWHYGPKHYTSLENIGLYWHLVDVIWIFLFPLLYLV